MNSISPIAQVPEIMAQEFIETIFETVSMPDEERVCITKAQTDGSGRCTFRNYAVNDRIFDRIPLATDPYYFCVSSVRPQGESETYLRRGRTDTRCAYVVGLDDIGTKAKAPSLEPSYKLETSPGNFQWGYLIAPYELDGPGGERTQYYEACIQGLIDAGLSDPGAGGCYRILRLPGSINTKPGNNGFRARVVYWAPDKVWELPELMEELGVLPSFKGPKKIAPEAKVDVEGDVLLHWLDENGYLVKKEDEFHTIVCPWAHEHTNDVETAGYSPIGAGGAEYTNSRQFHCFHDHCADRGIEEFLEFVRNKGGPDVSPQFDLSITAAQIKLAGLMVKEDPGQWFEEEALEALKVLRQLSKADYQRVRSQLKQKKGVSITELEKELMKIGDPQDVQLTHHGIAKALLTDFSVEDKIQPVACYGSLFRYREGIWNPCTKNEISKYVATSRYDGEVVCRLGTHYKSIAELLLNLSSKPDYFLNAPKGVAAGGYFYRITAQGIIEREILGAGHRCRFRLPLEPSKCDTPIFDHLLGTAFCSDSPKETAEQIALMQEVFGGVLLGLIASLQKAVVFYGESRAGKGVLVDIIKAMLPSETVSAVSPFLWGREYHIAAMAGKRLNLCGEFPEDNQLPAAVFKQVIGGDPISGRLPHQEVFTFVSEASQLFSCNYLPFCREQSDSFYNRWQVIHFPNSVPENKRDPALAEKVIQSELAGILDWALQGAARLIKQNRFSRSRVHDRMVDEWRLRSDSVAAFMAVKGLKLLEEYENRHQSSMPTSEFYLEYESYCVDERVKPAGKKTCFDRLKSIKGVMIKHFEDGDKVVRL